MSELGTLPSEEGPRDDQEAIDKKFEAIAKEETDQEFQGIAQSEYDKEFQKIVEPTRFSVNSAGEATDHAAGQTEEQLPENIQARIGKSAIWRNKDFEERVTVTCFAGEKDGVRGWYVEGADGHQSVLPENELDFGNIAA